MKSLQLLSEDSNVGQPLNFEKVSRVLLYVTYSDLAHVVKDQIIFYPDS